MGRRERGTEVKECKSTLTIRLLSREQEGILQFVAGGMERGVVDRVEKNLVGLRGNCTIYPELTNYPRPDWKCSGILQ